MCCRLVVVNLWPAGDAGAPSAGLPAAAGSMRCLAAAPAPALPLPLPPGGGQGRGLRFPGRRLGPGMVAGRLTRTSGRRCLGTFTPPSWQRLSGRGSRAVLLTFWHAPCRFVLHPLICT